MKPKLTIPVEEQELHINYCPAEMGKNCEIYTTIPWVMKHLEKFVNECSDVCKVIKDDQYSLTVSVPFKCIKPKKIRKLSEEQRQAVAKRFAEYRNK